ncbi:MAG: hypothetical protein ABSG73_03395 [Candidatus Aminicenantales bacterium]|jgi:hypothetical protein
MNLNDEELKRLYRSYIADKDPDNRLGCPSLEKLVFFFESSSRIPKKMKIIDHVTNCSSCAREFEFLLELQRYQKKMIQEVREAQSAESSPPSLRRSSQRVRLLWRFSSAFIGIILVIASLATIVQKLGHEDQTRAIRSFVGLMQPKPNQRVTLPLIFKWQEIAGAESYILELYDESLLPIWKSTATSATSFILPHEITGQLQLNMPYYWMITAYAHNDKLAESNLWKFTILQ